MTGAFYVVIYAHTQHLIRKAREIGAKIFIVFALLATRLNILFPLHAIAGHFHSSACTERRTKRTRNRINWYVRNSIRRRFAFSAHRIFCSVCWFSSIKTFDVCGRVRFARFGFFCIKFEIERKKAEKNLFRGKLCEKRKKRKEREI